MTNEEKILFFDRLMDMIPKSASEDVPVMVGTLKQPQGIKGFEKADIGHPVFEFKDRYIIYLKNDIQTVVIPFYKETLLPLIEPINK